MKRFTIRWLILVESGLAVKHDEMVWRNGAGDVVSCEKEAFGLKSPFEFIQTGWCLLMRLEVINHRQMMVPLLAELTCVPEMVDLKNMLLQKSPLHNTGLHRSEWWASHVCDYLCTKVALGFDPFVDWIGSEEAKILEKGRIASGSWGHL
jgi:hypothetical protein